MQLLVKITVIDSMSQLGKLFEVVDGEMVED
jgi:hypothetical protein